MFSTIFILKEQQLLLRKHRSIQENLDQSIIINFLSFEFINIVQILHTTRGWWVFRLKYKLKGLQNKITILKEITIFKS